MIYLDHNASSPVRPEVLEAMLPWLSGEYGNPNSVHAPGQRARKAVEEARERVAKLLGAETDEIVFTSSGSESNALALRGAALALLDGAPLKRTIVASPLEHESSLDTLKILEKRGFPLRWLEVGRQGLVDVGQARPLIGPGTALVSVMHANNEIGTVQPLEGMAELCRGSGVWLHTDAVQSAGKIPLNVRKLGIDLLSISGHKLGAPKGVGALFIRRGIKLAPLIAGAQEKNRRGGTENVAGIVGLGVACEAAYRELSTPEKIERLLRLRGLLEGEVLKINGAHLTGHPQKRLPHMAHFCFEGVFGHELVIALDLEGICVSGGSACSAGASSPSHVLAAMGVPPGLSRGALRISMGPKTTEGEIRRFLEVLPQALKRLRAVPAA